MLVFVGVYLIVQLFSVNDREAVYKVLYSKSLKVVQNFNLEYFKLLTINVHN